MPTAPYVDARAPLPPPPAGQRQIQMWISSQPGGDSLVFGAGGGGNLKAWPVCSCCIWRKASFCWNWFTSVTLYACVPTCTSPSYTEFQAG